MKVTFEQTKEIIDILLELTNYERSIETMYLNGIRIYDADSTPEWNARDQSRTNLLRAYNRYDVEKDISKLVITFSDNLQVFSVARVLEDFYEYIKENKVLYVLIEKENESTLTFI